MSSHAQRYVTPADARAPAHGEAQPFQWLPQMVAFIRRRLMLIAMFGMIGLLLGLGASRMMEPKFTATATLIIDSRRAHPLRTAPAYSDAQSENIFVESQVEVMRSAGTLDLVTDRLRLHEDPRFAPTGQPSAIRKVIWQVMGLIAPRAPVEQEVDEAVRRRIAARESLARMVDIRRIGTTWVVEIRARTADRNLSAQIANAVADSYVEAQIGAISDTTRRVGGWLEGRIELLRSQALAADRAVQEYKSANGIVEVGPTLMNEQQLGELNTQVSVARARVSETEARLSQVIAMAGTGGLVQGSVADAMQNPVMTRLRQQYLDASRREAELSARHGAGHLAVVNLRGELTELRRSMQNELDRITETYRSDNEVAVANLRTVEARLRAQVTEAAQTNLERSGLRSLQSSADTYRAIYENFLQRYTQAMQDQSYPIPDARLVTAATAPLAPTHPKVPLVLMVALCGGLAVGVAAAMVREALDSKVRTATQLRAATGLAVLGVVPKLAKLRDHGGRRFARLAARAAHQGQLLMPPAYVNAVVGAVGGTGDAVRGIMAAAAREATHGKAPQVIGCVSATPGEGSSTIAVNLAIAYAARGKRVLLVDCDTVKRTLSRVMAPGAPRGLLDVCARDALLDDVVLHEAKTGLRFLPLGAFGPGDDEGLLRAERRTIASLRGQADIVIVDLPALATSDLAMVLAEAIDSFTVVARWGHASQVMMAETMSRMVPVNASVLGVVLNACDVRRMRLYAGGSLLNGLPLSQQPVMAPPVGLPAALAALSPTSPRRTERTDH